jgi:ketosteroid isomerase-like protein
MRCIASGLVLLSALYTCQAIAQKGPCTDESVRAGVSSGQIPAATTGDFYLFNPVMDKPAVGNEERRQAFAAIQANTQLMANRKNFGGDPPKLDQVFVSSSGDMAYAYGTTHIRYDQQDGTHVDGTHAFLWVQG